MFDCIGRQGLWAKRLPCSCKRAPPDAFAVAPADDHRAPCQSCRQHLKAAARDIQSGRVRVTGASGPRQKHLNVQTVQNRPMGCSKAILFNDLIGTHKQRWRDGDTEGLCGLQIDRKLKLGRLFDRQVLRFFTQEKLVH